MQKESCNFIKNYRSYWLNRQRPVANSIKTTTTFINFPINHNLMDFSTIHLVLFAILCLGCNFLFVPNILTVSTRVQETSCKAYASTSWVDWQNEEKLVCGKILTLHKTSLLTSRQTSMRNYNIEHHKRDWMQKELCDKLTSTSNYTLLKDSAWPPFVRQPETVNTI